MNEIKSQDELIKILKSEGYNSPKDFSLIENEDEGTELWVSEEVGEFIHFGYYVSQECGREIYYVMTS